MPVIDDAGVVVGQLAHWLTDSNIDKYIETYETEISKTNFSLYDI